MDISPFDLLLITFFIVDYFFNAFPIQKSQLRMLISLSAMDDVRNLDYSEMLIYIESEDTQQRMSFNRGN